ncbi:PAS domain S-box-containing protein/diguanylate cyclase (GGDEF)-like protein [Saccharopolyspora dendranthemae]|uniref:PAS domain S-box-containing protein/diguanylate cyclase (GGDEF)-like protein n=1 Tax=Saccharopolyspora dendranthemae TaxID=1181886 RepID=A0A561U1G7_9PSEU|nr:PAS domain S-box-containing protein/diguanylate cyclase (GGDEF)-like protein [Saccharopolyspora dendranthemae]
MVSVVITGATFALRQRVEVSTDNLIDRIVPAQTETAQLITAYSDQENRVRAFLLTDDPSFLTDYALGQANASQLQDSLGRHLTGDPVVHELVSDVASAARRWHQQSVEPLISRNRGPGPSKLTPQERESEEERADELRAELFELRARVNEIGMAEAGKADGARVAANWLTVALALAGLLAWTAVGLLLRKSLTRPLRTLVSQVNQVSEGDLDRAVHESGPLELAAVARAVEAMRTRILSETRHIAQMQEELAHHEKAERRRAEQDFEIVVDALDEGVIVLDSNAVIESANPAAQRIFGETDSEIIGSSLDAWPVFDESGVALLPEDWPGWPGELVNSQVIRLDRADGTSAWLAVTSRVLNTAEGVPYKVVMSFADITESRAAQSRLEHEATHDPLTGLANRTLVLRHIEHAQQQGRSISVLFLDLDNFKIINDSLGHGVGDEVVRSVGQRLVHATPPEDLVGRLGGDEFVVLAHDESDHDSLGRRCGRLLASLTEPIRAQGRQLHLTGSIGVVVSEPGDERSGQDLLRDADVAMYQAKTRGGGGCYAYFDVELRKGVQRRMDLEQDLRHAVRRDQLWVAYQPVVDLRADRTVSVEGLLRWRHPVHGPVPPSEFIPVAEGSGLINPISEHMLRTATTELAAERERHQVDVGLNANLSPRQLDDPDLLALVQHALSDSGLPAHAVCLEVTEEAIMHDPAAAARVLNALRELGVSLAIDDFGTGYSSLAQLRRLPLDTLKIDRSFITDLGDSNELRIIVTSIVTMAHAIGLDVVAEGVETAEQFDILKELGCDHAQGYYLSKPTSLDQLLAPYLGTPAE